MNLISNDWKHLIGTETSQKSFSKTVYFSNKDTSEVKFFQKLSNKEIHFNLLSISTKYSRLFKFIS